MFLSKYEYEHARSMRRQICLKIFSQIYSKNTLYITNIFQDASISVLTSNVNIRVIFFLILSVPENASKGILCSSGRSWLCRRIKNSFRRKLLFKRIPILAWLPHYQKDYVVSDLVAGITVGLTVIPQAIAYANIAGIPLQVSLIEPSNHLLSHGGLYVISLVRTVYTDHE